MNMLMKAKGYLVLSGLLFIVTTVCPVQNRDCMWVLRTAVSTAVQGIRTGATIFCPQTVVVFYLLTGINPGGAQQQHNVSLHLVKKVKKG